MIVLVYHTLVIFYRKYMGEGVGVQHPFNKTGFHDIDTYYIIKCHL